MLLKGLALTGNSVFKRPQLSLSLPTGLVDLCYDTVDLNTAEGKAMKQSLRIEPKSKLEPPRLPEGRSPKAPSGLTLKQEQFARYLAAGYNQSKAYRMAYSAEGSKPHTVHCRASELARNSEVKARVEQLLQDKERVEEHLVGHNQDMWWKRIWQEVDPDDLSTTTPSSRVAALREIGKALQITTGEHEPSQPRQTQEDIAQQIMAKLASIKSRQPHDC